MLVIGGPAVFAGYVTDPNLGGPRVSRDGIVRDGWLDTGDLGTVNDDGLVYLTGRAKDLIIRGGHNIYPARIEALAMRHDAIDKVAAFPVPDARLGEKVCLAVVLRAGRALIEVAEGTHRLDSHALRRPVCPVSVARSTSTAARSTS